MSDQYKNFTAHSETASSESTSSDLSSSGSTSTKIPNTDSFKSIQVLNQDVINQISAGEVVERPAHLVKELLENSLDAGSTEILIETHSGGRFIRITDNGSGIPKAELSLALERHATSKINKAEDLWSLNTYGFRGEALASAAAVSELTLVSCTKAQEQAYQLKAEFGKLSEIMPASLKTGTQITIENLFENVPARLKFLKSDSAELAQIRQVVKALSLAYPKCEIKLIDTGKLDLFFKASVSTSERAQQILGVQKIYENEIRNSHFKVKAYFGSPHEVQKTSKNIWIFAQRRWIQDRALQTAVVEAYRSLLMHGEYPQCVIDLTCDTDVIDVNIHPTKSQVKFQNASDAFRSVHAAIRYGLEKSPWLVHETHKIESISNGASSAVEQKSFSDFSTGSFQKPNHELQVTQFKTKTSQWDQLAQLKVKDSDLSEVTTSSNISAAENSVFVSTKSEVSNTSYEMGYWSQLQVIGQLNLTYIVTQKDQKMILVDQHAAHERVAFERLMKKWKGGYIDQQDYLFPLAIDLSVEKVEALLFVAEDIKKMGIEIEALGPSVIGVKSAPAFIKEASLPRVFEKMSHDLIEYGGSFVLEKTIGDLFATMACHSVIRAGQSLSEPEMVELLKAMDEFPMSSFCPHGRPVSIEMSFHDIEKQFGRIV